MAEIDRPTLRQNVRAALKGRGLTWDGVTLGGDGPLADYIPIVGGGWWEVITPTRARRLIGSSKVHELERVPGVFVCDEFAWVGVAAARRYLLESYKWLGHEHPYPIGMVYSGHAQCVVWSTNGLLFWEPQTGGLIPPQPYEVRPGHWGIWAIVF